MRYKPLVLHSRAPLALPSALLALLGCGSEGTPRIAPVWIAERAVSMSPAGEGTGGRIVVAHRTAPGQWETLEATDGDNIEGPFETLPTAHAPVMVGAEVFLIGQVSGRLVRLDLAGQEQPVATLALGTTGPLVAAPDGGLRITANSGTLTIVRPDYQDAVQVDLPGVSDTPPAVDEDGTTYIATDVGEVVGFSAQGEPTFGVSVPAPASGASVRGGRLAVGAVDSVRVFDLQGKEIFSRPRDARVVGTRFTSDGDVLAWGEDGRLERLTPEGSVRFSLDLGPPIYAEVHEMPAGTFGVVDNDGRASLVSSDGVLLDQVEIAADETEAPRRQVARGPGALLTITRGKTLVGLDLGFLE